MKKLIFPALPGSPAPLKPLWSLVKAEKQHLWRGVFFQFWRLCYR